MDGYWFPYHYLERTNVYYIYLGQQKNHELK